MQLNVKHGRIQDEPTELIVVNLFEGVMTPGGATGAVDSALKGMISDVLASGDFKGKLNSTLVFYPRGLIGAKRVLLAGLGKAEKFGLDQARQVAATVAKKARELGVNDFSTIVHGAGIGGLAVPDAAQALAEGTLLGSYRFGEFKQPDENAREVQSVSIVEADPGKLDEVREGVRVGQIIATPHIGNLSEETARKNTYLFAKEVIPYLRDIWAAGYIWADAPGSTDSHSNLVAGKFIMSVEGFGNSWNDFWPKLRIASRSPGFIVTSCPTLEIPARLREFSARAERVKSSMGVSASWEGSWRTAITGLKVPVDPSSPNPERCRKCCVKISAACVNASFGWMVPSVQTSIIRRS